MADDDGRVMRDYYEVLSVEPDAEIDQIRRAYKKAALKCHPDRNHGREAEAEAEFKEMQQAYGVLSDEKEREWYDAHKESILRGDPDGNSAPDEVNLYPFFCPSCYNGFNDDAKGFFTVFRKVFQTVVEEEIRDMDKNKNSKGKFNPPVFGDSTSSFDDVVQPFYLYWSCFSTRKSFAWKDEYRAHDMPDRRNRRAAEQHNMKERNKAKKEFTALVVELVAYVRRRDPRVTKEEDRIAELEAIKEEARLQRAAEGIKRRREADRKLMEEVAAEEALAEAEEEARLAALEAAGGSEGVYGVDEQFEKYRQAEEERLAEEQAEKEALSAEVNTCECCGGSTFKGNAAWQAHQKSKKHKANLRTFKKNAPKVSPADGEGGASPSPTASSTVDASPTTGESPQAETPVAEKAPAKEAPSKKAMPSSKKSKKQKQQEAMQAKQQLKRNALPTAGDSSDDSSSDDSSDDAGPGMFGGQKSGFAVLGGRKKR